MTFLFIMDWPKRQERAIGIKPNLVLASQRERRDTLDAGLRYDRQTPTDATGSEEHYQSWKCYS